MAEVLSKILPIQVDERYFNVLDQFHSYSYKWSFFMINELQLKQNRFSFNGIERVTIAETGATSIFIDSVNMEVMYAPNESTLTAGRTMISMTILEPNGSNFFDLIYTTAAELRINNWSKLPFYLELSFTGYDEEGNAREVIGQPDPWRFRVQVTDVETEIDEGGTRYTLKAYSANDLAISENYGILPKAFEIKGNTFLAAITDLENKWNEFERKKNNESVSPLTQYKFVFYDDLNANPVGASINWQSIEMRSFDASRPSRKRIYDGEFGEEKAAFTEGYRVQNIIDSMMAASTFSDELEKKYPQAYSVNDLAEKLVNVSKAYKIETQVIYTTYDILSNDYEKLIIYHVWPYDGITQILTPADATGSTDGGSSPISEENKQTAAEKKAEYFWNQRIIRRVYNYIFTGKNTDILSFDLKYNSFWRAFLAEFGKGLSKDVGIDDRDITTATQRSENRRFFESNNLTGLLRNVGVELGTIADIDKQRKEVETERARLQAAINDSNRQQTNRLLRDLDARSTALTNARNQITDDPNSAIKLSRELQRTSTISGLENIRPRARYSEDLPQGGQVITPTIVPISVDSNSKKSPPSAQQGVESHFYDGQNFFGALLNQLYSTRNSDWMQIRMEIRGDPHWLGFDQMQKFVDSFNLVDKKFLNSNSATGRVLVNNNTDPNSLVVKISELDDKLKSHILGEEKEEPYNAPRFEVAEQAFLVNFRTPNVFRDADEFITSPTGQRIHKKSAFISGVYGVYQITHKFEDGLFTQEIVARKDPILSQYQLDEWYGESRKVGQRIITRRFQETSTTPVQVKPVTGISKGPNPNCTTRGCRNNNPGNLRGTYFGAAGSDGSFAIYSTPEDGVNAMSTQLDRYYTGKTTGNELRTTRDIISTYAPSNENDTQSYINQVSRAVGVTPDQELPLNNPDFKAQFMEAMIKHESGPDNGYDAKYIKNVISQ